MSGKDQQNQYVNMKTWLSKALLLAARTLEPAFDNTKDSGRALGALLGRSVLQTSIQEALSSAGLQNLSTLQRSSIEQGGYLLFNVTTSHCDRPRPGPCRREAALILCQMLMKLFRQEASWQLAAQVAYALPAFLTVTYRNGCNLADSWKQHMQLLWQLFGDSAYSKGLIAYTKQDRLREQADIAVAHSLLSICQEGQQSPGFQLSHGLLPGIAKGLLVNIPEVQSCCLQLIRINLFHGLGTNDVLAIFVKTGQKPKNEHQLLLKDPSLLRHSVKSVLKEKTGMSIEDTVNILEIATAVLIWPAPSTVGDYLPWPQIILVLADALQLPEKGAEWRRNISCRPVAAKGPALDTVLLPAMALLVAWSVTVLRSLSLHPGAKCKFCRVDLETMLSYLEDMILFSLLKHRHHRFRGILVLLATRLTTDIGHPNDESVARKLQEAVRAGLQSELLLQLVGPYDASASASGHGIRHLIANSMLGDLPPFKDDADCLFLPLAAWLVHDYWLPRAVDVTAAVRQFERWIQLYRSNSRHLDHVRVTYVRPAPTEVPQVDEHDESRIAVSNYATLLDLDGVADQVLHMDPSDKDACAMCLESAVASLAAALRSAQDGFDSLQADCFEGGHLWSTPGWAGEMLDAWSDSHEFDKLLSVAHQTHKQASSAGMDPKNSPACASLHAVVDAIDAMQHWQDAFRHASAMAGPNFSLLDVRPNISSSHTLNPHQAHTFSGPCPEAPRLPAALLKRKGSSSSSNKASRGQTDSVVRTTQAHQKAESVRGGRGKPGLPPLEMQCPDNIEAHRGAPASQASKQAPMLTSNPVSESPHVRGSSPAQAPQPQVSFTPTPSTNSGSGSSSICRQRGPLTLPLPEQRAQPGTPKERVRCPMARAQLPAASEPAPVAEQAAAGRAQTRRGGRKQRAKQLGSSPVVGQQASAQLQPAAAAVVPDEAVQVHSAAALCNAGNSLAGTSCLDNAQVPEQVPILPNTPKPALGPSHDRASAVASLPSRPLQIEPVKAPPALDHLPKASQEVPNSQRAGTAAQHYGAALPQYQLFLDAPTGRRCLQPSLSTPWLQPGQPDICERGRIPVHGLASGPPRHLSHPELAAAASAHPALHCGEEGQYARMDQHARQHDQVQALPGIHQGHGMLWYSERAPAPESVPYAESGGLLNPQEHFHQQPLAHHEQRCSTVTAPSQQYAPADPHQQLPCVQGRCPLPHAAYAEQPVHTVLGPQGQVHSHVLPGYAGGVQQHHRGPPGLFSQASPAHAQVYNHQPQLVPFPPPQSLRSTMHQGMFGPADSSRECAYVGTQDHAWLVASELVPAWPQNVQF